MKLSVIIPVFNEKRTILEILRRVEKIRIDRVEKEIILVDDFSTDGTREILRGLKRKYKVFFHLRNLGKGAAIRTALKHAKGEVILIQDADLEYSPEDYPKLIKPILEGQAVVVYGSRVLAKNSWSSPLYLFGGWLMNHISNLLYGSKLTDINCGYKVFKKDILDKITLESNRFEFCEEVTAKILKKNFKIKEVPIRYNARTFKEGKKLTWRDGFSGVATLVKYRFYDA